VHGGIMNVCTIPVLPFRSIGAVAEERVGLTAGSLYASSSPALINTVISSSVAVCLWSPAAGGMCHYVMPRGGSERSLRFGNHALTMLLDRLLDIDAGCGDLVAAVFGGATIMTADSGLSRRNLAAAREFLAKNDIPIIREDAGGPAARRLTFRTVDGSTIVRRL
jgi:chemotaxis protein CheD